MLKSELIKLVVIGSGGFIGAISRYVLGNFTQSFFPNSVYPLGTTIVNIVGCFLIGFTMSLFETKGWVNQELRLFLFVGILGGFTTFSTFLHDSFFLYQQNEMTNALLNIGVQVILGLLFIWIGYALAKLF